jgi:hypothetical protein
MALWSDPSQTHAESDMAVFYASGPPGQPAAPISSIVVALDFKVSWYNVGYDWSRIVAVEIDEPYNNTSVDNDLRYPDRSFACQAPALGKDMAPVDAMLQARATELKALAPKARFWVNFTDNEAGWMVYCSNPNQFNRDYIDVISADWSADGGNNNIASVQPFLSLVAANRPNSSQQLALIPGVYSAPVDQLPHLPGFFDFANQMNQAQGCNLPLGTRGVTGVFDGCPVWIVLGWYSGTIADHTYVGMLQPGSELIKQAWEDELHHPLAPSLAHQLSPAQIMQPILQELLLE